MRSRRVVTFEAILGLTLFLALVGCRGEGSACQEVTCPQYHPEITNRTDSFEFQVTSIAQVTQTVHFTWSNTGTRATINQASQLMAGTAQLTLRDAAGRVVYIQDLQANGTFLSAHGAAGTWVLQIALTRASGTINFRLEKGEG